MRLRRLDLIRYGHFTNRSFAFPLGRNPPPLEGGVRGGGRGVNRDFHIVFGPNEAGKSTALAAIEDLLFSIPVHSPYNFLHDYSSMRIGAVLENGEESLEVVRRKGSKNTLLGNDGLPFPAGEVLLRTFLAGAGRSFFERMFSLDHLRLEVGGREILEAKDEIGQMLFSAGTGIAGLRARLTKLSDEADELWAERRAAHRKYYQAEDKLKHAEQELRWQILTANKWRELKRTYETEEEAYSKVEAEFESVSAKRTRLGRIRRVYRNIRGKAEIDERIAALGRVIRLPEDSRQVLAESERKESEASTRIDTHSARLVKVREELETLSCDEQLLLHADDIGQLHERRIEIRGEKADLPKRQAELDVAETELRDLARELDWQEDEVGELTARIPKRTQLRAVRSLLAQHGELASGVEDRKVTLEEMEAERAELQGRLDAMGKTTDVSKLVAVIKTVRENVDVAGRVRGEEQRVKDAQERIDRLLSSLHPSFPSEEDVARTQVPSREEVRDHRDVVNDWKRRTRESDQQLKTAEQELERTRKNYKNAVRKEQAVTSEELQTARNDRDALWSLIKQKYIENVPISDDDAQRYSDVPDHLATAFEPAMRTADELADRRFDNAEESGRLAETSRNIDEQENSLEQMRMQQEALTGEGERLDADWKTLWSISSIKPLTPDAMLEWLEVRDELLKAIEGRAEARGVLEIRRKEEREAKESILVELSLLGIDRAELEDCDLRVILERADIERRKYEQEAEDKAQLLKDLQEAATNVTRRCRELTRAKEAKSLWQEKWSAALTELGLATDSNPEDVSAQIDVIDQMRETVVRINELRLQRIDKINRDITEFESDVAKSLIGLADDLAGTVAEDAVLEIEKRLSETQRIRDLRANKEKEIEEIENTIRSLEKERQESRDSVDHLMQSASADTTGELKSAIEKSDSLHALHEQLNTILQTLEQEGDGLSVIDLEAECDAVDIDRIVAQEETTGAELKTLRDQLTAAAEARSQARGAFQAIGGDDAAARAEAKRQEALVEIREVSERFVRVRTSAMLLQWAIDRYRQEKQAPLLKRAGELFASITGESFKDLRVDYDEIDQAHLIGLRPDGKVVDVPGMSSGTADQLYLALRIASIEDYLERADALPFVADDLFINFDNDRAGASFEVLSKLSEKTQVLFFTHHLHLLEIAKETLEGSISIVDLSEEEKT